MALRIEGEQKPNPFDYGLRSRMVLLLVVMLVPFIIFSTYEAYSSYNTVIEEKRQENQRNAREVAGNVDELVQGTADLLIAIARSEPARGQDFSELKSWFKDISEKYPYYKNIIYVDPDGRIRAAAYTYSKPDGSIIADVSSTAYYKRAVVSSGLSFGDYMQAILSKKPVIHMTYPVFDNNERLGFIAIAFDLARLQKRIVAINIPKGSEVCIFDQNNTILARTAKPEQFIGKNFGNTDMIQQVRAGSLNQTGLGPDGISRVMTFRQTQQAPWLVSVCFEEELARSEAISRLLRQTALFLPLMLIALLGWLWIGRDVDDLYKAARRLRLTDTITSLGSFLKFNQDLPKDIARAKMQVEPLSLVHIDIDRFAKFNDEYGYRAGNMALKWLADNVEQSLRETDTAYRCGGDEICLLLSNTDELDAKELAEKLRASVLAVEFPVSDNKTASISISIGIAVYPLDAKNADDLALCAKEALFEAMKQPERPITAYSETEKPRKVKKGES